MRKRIVVAMSVAVAASGIAVAGTSAQAADCSPGPTDPNAACTVNVTAVVGTGGLTGVRTLGAVAPVALAGTGSLTGALAVPVVEAAASGTNWSVTASASALTDASSDSIPATDLSVSDTALPSGVGCLSTLLAVGQRCAIVGGAAGRTLDNPTALLTETGEATGTAYTGTYAYSGLLTLNVPNGTPAGTYTGQLTLTLVQ